MVEINKTNNQIPMHKNHLNLPDVLFSAIHAPHLRPPASKKNVCKAITNDQIADAMSPELIKNP
jgi:hypothetical protein